MSLRMLCCLCTKFCYLLIPWCMTSFSARVVLFITGVRLTHGLMLVGNHLILVGLNLMLWFGN